MNVEAEVIHSEWLDAEILQQVRGLLASQPVLGPPHSIIPPYSASGTL
jgi:hypothetical protein